MTAVRRIHSRTVRRLTKPLRLAVLSHQLAASDQNIAYFEDARKEAAELIAAEHRRQVALQMARLQIMRGVA